MDLSLLFKIRGDAAGAKQATAETRAAVAQLKTSLGGEFNQIQRAGQTALSGVGSSLNNFAAQRIPLVGNALAQLTPQFTELAGESATAGASIGAMAGPVGLAVGAFVALQASAVLLVQQFIALTLATAEWQGKLFDLSQQTGVSVETLSALEAVAETTGGSIDSIAQSLVVFQGNLEEAQDSSSKAGKQFTQLGISTNDTEQALRDALKALAAMPEGFRQTNDAAELFGRRGGKQFLAILKETNGDIDGTIEKLRALDSLVTGPVARGADKLNDKVRETQRQFRGLTAQIVNESMPLIVRALQTLSNILRENRDLFILLGQAIGLLLQGNLRILAPAVATLSAVLEGHRRALAPLVEMYQQFAAVLQIVSGNLPSVDPNAIPVVGAPPVTSVGIGASVGKGITRPKGTGGGRGGGKSTQDTTLQDAIAEAALAERELRQKIEADVAENKRALDEQARDIEEFTRRAIELAEQRHDATIVRINAEIAALDQAYAKKLISQKEYNQKNRELDIENADAAQKFSDEKWEVEQQRDRQIAEAKLAAYQRSVQIADEASERLIRIIKDRVDREIITESEGERQIAEIIAEGFRRRKAALEEELTYITTSLERKEEITDDLIRLEGERADAAVQASQRIIDALKKEQEEREKARKALEDAAAAAAAGAGEGAEKRKPGAAESGFLFGLETGQLAELEDGVQSFADVATLAFSAVGMAVSGLAQGIGGLVENWVLMGSTGPNAMKKMVASVLAGVAAQAAVLAIFELAKGFAALFFNPAEAASHFTAAALFGSIAVGTALAGRAVAGDSFKQVSDKSSSGTSRGSTSTAPRRNEPIDVNRSANSFATQTISNELVFKVKGDALVETFVRDYNLNGRTRVIIKSDGQG